ncbi:hypothetical protein K2173_012385 [Erythroxylum novogranatense]|uniref:Thioredoxin-like protein Clot n=1 Tax=Erythroxylum novogranatense TaxID=1862640 RepID=A0AAV8U9Q9_9ROSI|nr:hypothetical protein K2173_012385 [Erythroxylum novogranatense]
MILLPTQRRRRRTFFFLASIFILLLFVFSFRFNQIQETKIGLKMVDATLSSFDAVFDKFRADAPNFKFNLILFLADKDPSTNLSWCPDCVRAEPVIYKKLEAYADEVALLRAYVGDRPTWRNSQHPWRVDSRFKLTGVPTLISWDWNNDSVKARLEDHEAHLDHKIDDLLSASD